MLCYFYKYTFQFGKIDFEIWINIFPRTVWSYQCINVFYKLMLKTKLELEQCQNVKQTMSWSSNQIFRKTSSSVYGRVGRPRCTKNGPAGGGDTIIVKISNWELAQFWYRATGQPTLHGGRLTTDRHTTRISLSVSFSMTKLTKSYIPYVLVHNQSYQLSQSYISPHKPKYPETFY